MQEVGARVRISGSGGNRRCGLCCICTLAFAECEVDGRCEALLQVILFFGGRCTRLARRCSSGRSGHGVGARQGKLRLLNGLRDGGRRRCAAGASCCILRILRVLCILLCRVRSGFLSRLHLITPIDSFKILVGRLLLLLVLVCWFVCSVLLRMRLHLLRLFIGVVEKRIT